MARLREYTPARRRAMQILMWLIFAATYAGAATLTHARAQALRVNLTPAMGEGDLLYRLPAGWKVERRKRPTVRISAIEPGGLDRMHRVVQIHLSPYESDAPTATDFMATRAGPAVHVRPFAFKNLGQGILWETAAAVTEDDDERHVTPPELYACIVAPRSAHSSDSVAIVVGLVGPMVFGPSSVNLVQSIADSLVLAPNGSTPRAVSPDGGG